MKKQDFIELIESVGLRDNPVAQHYCLGQIWEKLFPQDAQVERLSQEIDNLREMVTKMFVGEI